MNCCGGNSMTSSPVPQMVSFLAQRGEDLALPCLLIMLWWCCTSSPVLTCLGTEVKSTAHTRQSVLRFKVFMWRQDSSINQRSWVWWWSKCVLQVSIREEKTRTGHPCIDNRLQMTVLMWNPYCMSMWCIFGMKIVFNQPCKQQRWNLA